MRKTYVTAAVIALVLIAWLYSGDHSKDPIDGSIADINRANARIDADAAPTRVRVSVIEASEQARLVRVRGKTENKRTVTAKAELSATVIARPVERGSLVRSGDLLCDLSVEDRVVAVTEAEAALEQARIDYDGALRLKEKGFNSNSAIAAAKARLAASKAELSRRQLDLAKLKVRAPFDGIVEDVHQEIGDFVSPGAACATIVDLDPMLLVGRVSEKEVANVKVGQITTGLLGDGRAVSGPITFVGQQSDPATRTYAVEIELDNADHALRSGITTEIHIPVEDVMAQKISPALFSLNDAGDIGIRLINEANVVEFHLVDILADAPDGVWVTGLPHRAAVITVGQELVTPGERVDPVFQGSTLRAESQAGGETATDTSSGAGFATPELNAAIAH